MAEKTTTGIYLRLAQDLLDLALRLESERDREILTEAADELTRVAIEDEIPPRKYDIH